MGNTEPPTILLEYASAMWHIATSVRRGYYKHYESSSVHVVFCKWWSSPDASIPARNSLWTFDWWIAQIYLPDHGRSKLWSMVNTDSREHLKDVSFVVKAYRLHLCFLDFLFLMLSRHSFFRVCSCITSLLALHKNYEVTRKLNGISFVYVIWQVRLTALLIILFLFTINDLWSGVQMTKVKFIWYNIARDITATWSVF